MKIVNLEAESHYSAGLKKAGVFKNTFPELKKAFYNFKPFFSSKIAKLFSKGIEIASSTTGSFGIIERIKKVFPEQFEFYKGLLEGSSYKSLISLSIVVEILISKTLTLPFCSSVVMKKDNFKVLGKNFDFLYFIADFLHLEIRKGKKFKFIGSSLPSSITVFEGMNEKGLAISYNYGYSKKGGRLSPPISSYITKALGEFEKAEDFLYFIKNELTTIPNGAIVSVLDGDRNSYSIEISPPNKVSILELDEFFRSNIYKNPDILKYSIPENKRFPKSTPIKYLRRTLIQESNIKRFKRGDELLKKGEVVFSILKDHGGLKEGGENTICRHSPLNPTLASYVFSPEEKKLYYKKGNPCKGEYSIFSFT